VNIRTLKVKRVAQYGAEGFQKGATGEKIDGIASAKRGGGELSYILQSYGERSSLLGPAKSIQGAQKKGERTHP